MGVHCQNCACTEALKRITKHCSQKSVLPWYKRQRVIAETSVKHYTGFGKISVLVFLSVCDAIEVAEIIRFAGNLEQMFISYAKLICIFFAVYCPNSAYTEIHKSVSKYCRLWTEIL